MKSILFLIAITFALNTAAQETDNNMKLPAPRKNEIGVLVDPGISGYNPQSQQGIQYKRWVTPDFKAYRANIGFGRYTTFQSDKVYPAAGDTVYKKDVQTDIPSLNLGIGIEMQRHFYKRVYLYAAIDLYGAYGSGTTKDLLHKEVFDNDVSVYQDIQIINTYNSSVFRIGVLPLAGAKFQFSRISFGTELTGVKMEYSSVHHEGKPSPGGLVDLNLGDFTQRVFFNYRF